MTRPGDKPPPVTAETYTDVWVDGMGGTGSDDRFRNSGGRNLRPRLTYSLDIADLKPGLRVLDIGCGRGEVVIRSAAAGAALAVGVDYAPVSLDRAARNAEALNFRVNQSGSPIVLARSDAKTMPFADGSFDRVLMLDIVEHLHEWELQRVWTEVKRLLAPGGYLVVHTLPNRWAIDYGYKIARLLLRRLPAEAPDKRDIFHVNEQSAPSLWRSLSQSGLKSRVWLKDMILAQADWMAETGVEGEEVQELVYERLTRPKWRRLYRLAAALPSRLILVTDLFAVAWADGPRPDVLANLPKARAETAARLLGG